MDKEKYTHIVIRYYDDIKRVAYAGCKNIYDAEDITQTVFLKLSQYTGSFEDDEHIKKWLVKVAVNESRSLWRSPWRSKSAVDEPDIIYHPADMGDSGSDVMEAVMSLKRKYREVIHLFYYEEYSAREIAGVLGISENAVFKRLERARYQIKCRLDPKGLAATDTLRDTGEAICKTGI